MPQAGTRRKLLLCLAAAGVVACASAVAAVPAASPEPPSQFADIERRLDAKFRGVVLATRDGAVVYRRAFGEARAGVPNDPAMRFRIGSVSKTFTAALVASLAKEGKVSLSDPIETFVPGMPGGARITLQHLIEHKSGLADFSQADWRKLLLSPAPASRDEVIALIAGPKVKAGPGEKFAYNNAGYVLLGLVIEKVTEESYPDALQERLAAPLALDDTGFAARDGAVTNLSTGHGPNGAPDPADYDYTAIAAAGGLYATAADLARWCAGDAFNAPHLAWRQGERFGRKAYWHAGNTNDYSALLVRFPEIDGCYVVLSNVGRRPPPKDIMRALPERLFGAR